MSGDEKSLPQSTSSATSMSILNKLLSSITLVALGAIAGFAVFHSALEYRIQQTEQSQNATLAVVTSKFVESEKERNRCIETDNGRLQEMADLRGRLDAQYKSWYDLTAAQRSVASQQKENMAQIKQFREAHERDQQTLASLKAESKQKNSNILAIQEDLERYHIIKVELESDLTRMQEAKDKETLELQGQIQNKDRELDAVLQSLKLLSEEKVQLEKESRELETGIQQKNTDLENFKKTIDTLQVDVAGMTAKLNALESEIVEKDKELFKYREEEGNLEAKLINFREGMIGLLTEKIHEIQDLENDVESLNNEKAELELKLENWREGMLKLLKEKIKEIEELKSELADSRKTMETMMHEIELARSEQVEAEESVNERLETIDLNSGEGQDERLEALMQEIEQLRADLQESQEWVVAATEEIDHFKSDQAEIEKLIRDKTNEIKNLKENLESDQKSAEEEISQLQSDLEEARKSVDEKTNQVEHLSSELGEFLVEIKNLKSVLSGSSAEPNDTGGSTTSEILIDHVQQRDSVMCRQLFGKGPYYVKFVIQLPPIESEGGLTDNSEQNNTMFFVIELPFRKEFPHSTYTFLTLVESNLYNDGVAVLSARDGGSLEIGSRDFPGTISLEQKLKPLGLTGGSSLGFVESSTSGESFPCGEFSFGFVQRGPGLSLSLLKKDAGERTVADKEANCFAQVIRGQENLQKIHSLFLNGEASLEIISAKHLRVD